MPRCAKLYTDEAAFDEAVQTLETHFNIEAPKKWCEKERVISGEHEGKLILLLPDQGSFKANHMFSSTTDFDSTWFEEGGE